jgi:uracil phosphoribosyltransferase
MKNELMRILRDKNTTRKEYWSASDRLGYILALEASEHVDRKQVVVQTPLAPAACSQFNSSIILVPILRSGLALLHPFMNYYTNARVGFVGMRRDEKTAVASLYYKNLPSFTSDDDVIVLDPMIATGGSAIATLEILLSSGIAEEKIIFVGIVAAPEGLAALKSAYPKLRLVVAQIDEKLNAHKFILPGLGDFGDRYFGTEQ